METKYCSSCKEVKSVNAFHRRGAKYQPYCKACKKAHDKVYYQNHTPQMKAQIKARKETVIGDNRKKLYEYFILNPCSHCGNSDFRVLEFHHRNPEEKDYGVGQILCWNVTWERIMREISKCDVLCANCHRIETSKQQNWWSNTFVSEMTLN